MGSSAPSLSYCFSSLSCAGITSNFYVDIQTSVSCSCSNNVMTVVITSELPSGLIEFSVNKLRNPSSTASISGFLIQTGFNSGIIETSSSLPISVAVNTPNTLTGNFLQLDDYLINAETRYEFELKCKTPIPASASLSIEFPNDFVISPTITTSIIGVFSLNFGLPFTLSSNKITIDNGFSNYISENSIITFDILNVKNPSSAKTSGYISIKIYSSTGSICQSETSSVFSVTSTPGSLKNIMIYNEVSTINAVSTYTFEFEANNPIPIGGTIKITAPTQVYFENYDAEDCKNIDVTSVLSQNTECHVTENIYL